MKHSVFIRRIDELGRIVLPIEIRQVLGIKEKDPLEISMIDNGVFIQKNHATCIFCNSTNNLSNYKEKNICKECLSNIKEISKTIKG